MSVMLCARVVSGICKPTANCSVILGHTIFLLLLEDRNNENKNSEVWKASLTVTPNDICKRAGVLLLKQPIIYKIVSYTNGDSSAKKFINLSP